MRTQSLFDATFRNDESINKTYAGVVVSSIGLDSKPNIVAIVGIGLSGAFERIGSITGTPADSSGMCRGDLNCSGRV